MMILMMMITIKMIIMMKRTKNNRKKTEVKQEHEKAPTIRIRKEIKKREVNSFLMVMNCKKKSNGRKASNFSVRLKHRNIYRRN